MPETPAAALRAAMDRQAAAQAEAKKVAAEIAADVKRRLEETVTAQQSRVTP